MKKYMITFLCGMLGTALWGQNQITGQIVDSNGETIPFSKVTLTRSDTTIRILSDIEGKFIFDKVEAGSYSLTIKNMVYEETTIEKIPLGQGESLDVGEIQLNNAVITGCCCCFGFCPNYSNIGEDGMP